MQNLSKNIFKGIVAGFIATAVLTLLMALKTKAGLIPELDPVASLTQIVNHQFPSAPAFLASGWFLHFFIGSVSWGAGLVLFNQIIPGKSQLVKGLYVGIAAWLLMMVGFMPIAGKGLFALNVGMPIPIMTFILHIIFGATLGTVYQVLNKKTGSF